MARRMFCIIAIFLGLASATPGLSRGADAKVPMTVEEHLTLAKQYEAQAVANRKEAQEHKEMAAAYRGSYSHNRAQGQADPWVVKMEKHCALIAATAEKLAAQNEMAAEYHKLRAKELQGK